MVAAPAARDARDLTTSSIQESDHDAQPRASTLLGLVLVLLAIPLAFMLGRS